MVRSVRAAIDGNDTKAAVTELGAASRALAKAATKGVIHRNVAARKIARLSRAVHALAR